MLQQNSDSCSDFNDYCNFILSHICFDDEDDESTVCKDIIAHKEKLDKELGRDVGIEVALVDYMKNINHNVRTPDILDCADIRRIAHSNTVSSNPRAYDASVLSEDMKVEVERAHRYGAPFSIILIDVFSGETPPGEDIIGTLIAGFSDHIRLTDRVYTYNKNRFIFLLAETNVNAAIKTALNLRDIYPGPDREEDTDFHYNIGIASYGLFHIDNDLKMLTAADKAMKEAAREGRGLIHLYHGKDILEINDKGEPIPHLKNDQTRREMKGVSVHPGTALGTLFVYNDILSHKMESYDIRVENLDEEYKRIELAIHKVEKDLMDMEEEVNRELSSEHSVIFMAHRLMLNDKQILDEIKTQLYERRVNAEEIIRDVFKRWEKRFLSFDDEVFKSKSQDIADISRRVLTELQGIESHILGDVPSDSVIFSVRLLPSDTVHINRKNVKAIVTREGSHYSHTAIIAKAMNIPMIIMEDLDLSVLSTGSPVYLDGATGHIVINPGPSELEELKNNVSEGLEGDTLAPFDPIDEKPLMYRGEAVKLHTVVASLDDSRKGLSAGAGGIGLFRMEVLFLTCDSLPGETWLFDELCRIFTPFRDREIVIRLLDLGGDKSLSYMNISERYNSSLGVRGIRLLFQNPRLLESQLRLCLRLSREFNIKILIPMVTLVSDVVQVKELLEELRADMNIQKHIPLGSMIETPAAVIGISEILDQSDFVSIGSNDLIQYTMAADREKLNVSRYFEEGNVLIQNSLRQIFTLASRSGKPCCLCGELAQNTVYTGALLELGCRNFSVGAAALPSVKQVLRTLCR